MDARPARSARGVVARGRAVDCGILTVLLQQLPILLIEDDDVGVMTVRRAFRSNNVTNPLYAVKNGLEALDFLNRRGVYAATGAAPRPGLLLLDLNMPLMSGIEFLQARHENASLRTIPAVVLTTSSSDEDLQRCYDLGVSGYIVKPVRFAAFVEALRTVNLYWTLCAVPSS